MVREENKGIIYFTFSIFKGFKGLIHGISTRIVNKGSNKDSTSFLNLGISGKEGSKRVKTNRRVFCQGLGANYSRLTLCQQIHEDNVVIIDEEKNIFSEKIFPGADGMITHLPFTPLMILVADCPTLFFFDPKKKVAGLAHAGWRGSIKGIGNKLVKKMIDVYGSSSSDIRAGIGPSIGPCCYEVREDVIEDLRGAFPFQWEKFILKTDKGLFYMDLWKLNYYQLQEIGIKEKHIELADICTGCNSNLFFSFRKEKGNTGRFGALIQIA